MFQNVLYIAVYRTFHRVFYRVFYKIQLVEVFQGLEGLQSGMYQVYRWHSRRYFLGCSNEILFRYVEGAFCKVFYKLFSCISDCFYLKSRAQYDTI